MLFPPKFALSDEEDETQLQKLKEGDEITIPGDTVYEREIDRLKTVV